MSVPLSDTHLAVRAEILSALSRAGAFCGECGFQPGDTGCADCVRVREMYADAVMPTVDRLRSENERLAEDAARDVARERGRAGRCERDMVEAIAETDRLRAEAAKEERAHLATIDERDHAQDMADKLAYAIAPMEVIGEHSSDNCPWTNAEEEAHALHAKVKELGKELADTAMMRDFYQRSAEHIGAKRDLAEAAIVAWEASEISAAPALLIVKKSLADGPVAALGAGQ